MTGPTKEMTFEEWRRHFMCEPIELPRYMEQLMEAMFNTTRDPLIVWIAPPRRSR